jgi:multidrug resistance efflux pump
MFELLLCSILTILPDYLYRRYGQGKRIGKELNLFTVWYELRWGITGCLMLTVLLITSIFFFHPATHTAISAFRTIPIVPETIGRVSEILVENRDQVKKGQPLFKLDSSLQAAAVDIAKRRIAEIDAERTVAESDVAVAAGKIQQAQNGLKQIEDELRTKTELRSRNSGTVTEREIERLQTAVAGAKGELAASEASERSAALRFSTLLPARKLSAEAQLKEAEADLARRVIYAGLDGKLEQFILRVGDLVNPMMRPAGILIPSRGGERSLQAAFNQIESTVLKPGMAAEATCVSLPFQIIPLQVIAVQDFIAAGQVRAGEQLIEVQTLAKPGSVLASLKPTFDGGLDRVLEGSHCIVNAYTNNHHRLTHEKLGPVTWFALHAIDALAFVHALILRVQALLLPVQTLVFAGH